MRASVLSGRTAPLYTPDLESRARVDEAFSPRSPAFGSNRHRKVTWGVDSGSDLLHPWRLAPSWAGGAQPRGTNVSSHRVVRGSSPVRPAPGDGLAPGDPGGPPPPGRGHPRVRRPLRLHQDVRTAGPTGSGRRGGSQRHPRPVLHPPPVRGL